MAAPEQLQKLIGVEVTIQYDVYVQQSLQLSIRTYGL